MTLAEKIAAADYILGSDEAGAGAWAGPLLVAAVLAPRGWKPSVFTDDSKEMEEPQRERAFEVLVKDPAIQCAIWEISHELIDSTGLGKMLIFGHRKVHDVAKSKFKGEGHIVQIADGVLKLGDDINCEPQADGKYAVVSAASVLAKVTRDRIMKVMAVTYPGYGFENHKGYGGKEGVHAHSIALAKLGPCFIHRKSYGPIARMIRERSQVPLDSFKTEGE